MAPQLAMMDVPEAPARRMKGPGTVGDVMRRDIVMLQPDSSAADAMLALEKASAGTGVLALGDRIIGVVTHPELVRVSDALERVAARSWPVASSGPFLRFRDDMPRLNLRAGDVMTPQAVTGRSDWPLPLGALTMDVHHVRRLPILNGRGDLVGVLFRADVKAAAAARLGLP